MLFHKKKLHGNQQAETLIQGNWPTKQPLNLEKREREKERIKQENDKGVAHKHLDEYAISRSTEIG